ncbi:NAD(P)H-binding protein [Fibrella aestuarina]|uniref:NAD(P)H-binding protein n=2 Tax=Fibrivirga algicola TaxID=2950420 RepID=A0ABX0QDM2_9BACT|nr:NAD(P)H-binding protein [Fibrivirga algicola]
MPMRPLQLSLIGLGWLGIPLAERLQQNGTVVQGSTTTPDKLALLRQKGIDTYLLRLTPAPEGDLQPLLDADYLVVNIPPKAGQQGDAFHPEQMRLLADQVRSSRIKHILYVSSTSVYPELNRDMVEDDVITPDQSAAPALAEAEQIWLSLADQHRAVTIVRCAGLMGDRRIPGKYVAGRTVDSGNVPVNYIHQSDAVGLLAATIEQALTGTFNAVAPQHPTREAIYRKSCADFGYALPTFVTPAEPIPYKVINGDKLMQATGYEFTYPDPLAFPYSA